MNTIITYCVEWRGSINFDKERFAGTLRKIRSGKGIKQSDVTNNVMSRSTYSKIERGLITPGIVNFYNILSRLNIGFEEFLYIYNGYAFDSRWKIINEFKNTRGNFDSDKLIMIKNMCEDFLRDTDDSHINNIKCTCLALLKIKENDFNTAKAIAEKVWSDLSNRETWFFDDVFIINNIFFMFEGKTIESMYSRAIDYLNKYGEFQSYWGTRIRFSLQFNKLSYDMFYGNRSKELQLLIDKLLVEAREFRYYDLEAILFIRKGLILSNEALIDKGLQILKVLELHELVTSAQEEINIYMSTVD